jgi:hypothetical protein
MSVGASWILFYIIIVLQMPCEKVFRPQKPAQIHNQKVVGDIGIGMKPTTLVDIMRVMRRKMLVYNSMDYRGSQSVLIIYFMD